jgi:chromosomal replication initiator protein
MNLLDLPEFRQARTALEALEPKPDNPHIPVVLLWGPRGCGRTELLRQASDHWRESYGKQAAVLTKGALLATRRLEDKRRVPMRRLLRPPLVAIDAIEATRPKVMPRLAWLLDQRDKEMLATAFTLDRPPAELKADPRLVERLLASLVVEIPCLGQPSREQALDVLLAKHRMRTNSALRDGLSGILAPTLGGIDKQVRALVAALPEKLPVDEALARCRRAGGTISLDQIISLVCQSMKVDRKALLSPGRQPTLVRARQLVLVLARRFTELSLAKLGRSLGGRDPATLRHSLESFHSSCDKALRLLHKRLEREVDTLRAGTNRS